MIHNCVERVEMACNDSLFILRSSINTRPALFNTLEMWSDLQIDFWISLWPKSQRTAFCPLVTVFALVLYSIFAALLDLLNIWFNTVNLLKQVDDIHNWFHRNGFRRANRSKLMTQLLSPSSTHTNIDKMCVGLYCHWHKTNHIRFLVRQLDTLNGMNCALNRTWHTDRRIVTAFHQSTQSELNNVLVTVACHTLARLKVF